MGSDRPWSSRSGFVPLANHCVVEFQLSLESEGPGSAYPETPVAVDDGVLISDVIRLMQTERVGAVIVCEQDKLVGIFTERDALKLMASHADLSRPITEVMTASPVTVSSDDTVGEMIRKMSEGGYRHLPIVEAREKTSPIGMVDVKGIIHYLVEHFPNAIYNLPPNPQQQSTNREGA